MTADTMEVAMDAEEVKAVVEAVLKEREESGHRRLVRRPTSKVIDPTGKTWYSGAISKVQLIGYTLGLLGGVFSSVWAGMEVRDRLTVYPHVESMIEQSLDRHKAETRREMETLAPRFATAEDLNEVRQAVAVESATQSTQLAGIKEQLDRIEQRLARIGR